jgi:hypothetical protein
VSAQATAALTVLRGNPTPGELAGLLVVFAALRGAGDQPDPPSVQRRWGRSAGWHRPQITAAPDAAGWQRTPAPTHERTS